MFVSLVGKIIKNPRKAINVFSYKLLSCVGNTDFKRFIILSRSRTGSNLLRSFLNSHPNVNAESEIVRNLNGRSYNDVLDKVYGKQPYYIKGKGFKIFYYHPLDDPQSKIWDELSNQENLHVIHLKRRNTLRTLISRKIARNQDVWQASSAGSIVSGKSKAVTFSKEELVSDFTQTRDWESEGHEMFNRCPLISLYYEDLVRDPVGTLSGVTDFLEVSPILPKTALRKQNIERLSDLIMNYGELKSAFSGTEWQKYFDE